jgi:hypothetical protein
MQSIAPPNRWLCGVFRRKWEPPHLQPWEGPFADPTQRLPQHPKVAAERQEAKRRYRLRQAMRGAEAAKLAAERDAGADIADRPPRTSNRGNEMHFSAPQARREVSGDRQRGRHDRALAAALARVLGGATPRSGRRAATNAPVAARRPAARQQRRVIWSTTCLVAVLITVCSPINAAGAFLNVAAGEESGDLGA